VWDAVRFLRSGFRFVDRTAATTLARAANAGRTNGAPRYDNWAPTGRSVSPKCAKYDLGAYRPRTADGRVIEVSADVIVTDPLRRLPATPAAATAASSELPQSAVIAVGQQLLADDWIMFLLLLTDLRTQFRRLSAA